MRCRFRRSAYDLLATEEVGSLGAGAVVHACACEDAATPASGYRSDLEHRSRAPISCPRTMPQRRRCGDPLPDSVGVHSPRSHSMSGQHTSAAGPSQGANYAPSGDSAAAALATPAASARAPFDRALLLAVPATLFMLLLFI